MYNISSVNVSSHVSLKTGTIWLNVSYFFFYSLFKFLYHIYPTPPLGQDMTQGQFFKRSLTGFNSEFSIYSTSCLTKAEEPSLPYYLPIAGRRIIGFIPFPRVLVLCEMQSVQDMKSCRQFQFYWNFFIQDSLTLNFIAVKTRIILIWIFRTDRSYFK